MMQPRQGVTESEAQEEAEDTSRSRPTVPYHRTGAVLTVPRIALAITFDVFEPYAQRRVEAGCFWYGERDPAGNATVRAVVVPKQTNTWGNYRVSADAMAAVAASTRPSGWLNLAQLHTHPGKGIEHSRYDDEHANSRRALSLVFPTYGRCGRVWSSAIGTHEWQDEFWHLLTPEVSAERVQIVAEGDITLVDVRWLPPKSRP